MDEAVLEVHVEEIFGLEEEYRSILHPKGHGTHVFANRKASEILERCSSLADQDRLLGFCIGVSRKVMRFFCCLFTHLGVIGDIRIVELDVAAFLLVF